MRRSRPLLLAAVALSALLLTSCASIPVSSPVQTAAPQQEQDNPAGFVPNGPVANAVPADVVSGFVRAQGAGGRYTVAKQFLTEAEAKRWRPNASVLVHAQAWTVEADDADVTVRVPTVAAVDGVGQYTPRNASESLEFVVKRENGQWRIDEAPDGVLLSTRAFPGLFTSTPLQFFDPTGTRLIPDVRWFPVGSDIKAEVVAAVLAGQSPVLAQVTESVFPVGTELASPVRSSGDVVTVDVSAPGRAPDEQATDRMQQALAGPMDVPLASLRLVVNGAQAPVAPPVELQQLSATSPVVYAGGRFGPVNAQGAVTEDRDLGAAIARLRPRAVTVSARQRIAAVLGADRRVSVVSGTGTSVVADRRSGLIAPSLDQRGWVYSVPGDDPGGLIATDAKNRHVDVQGDLGGAEVTAIEVSPDGTRLLILRRSASGVEASVAGILRGEDGTPLALTTDRYPIALDGTDAIDATWIDQTSIAVLLQEGTGQRVVTQQLGGIPGTLATLSNARTIVGATGLQDLRVLLGTGDLLQLSSNSWVPEQSAADDIAVLAVQR